jgi:hypothetical protein
VEEIVNEKEFVIPQAVATLDGIRYLVQPEKGQPGTEYRCPECHQVVRLRKETRDEGNRVTRAQHFAHTGESCRWKTLTERPCLVKIEHGETTIAEIRTLATLCGRSCEEAGSMSARAAADKEGYCMTCLSRVGLGVLR